MATPTTPASTSAAPATQGTIVFVQGEAYLRDRQGKLQAIKPGDAVAEGQEIVYSTRPPATAHTQTAGVKVETADLDNYSLIQTMGTNLATATARDSVVQVDAPQAQTRAERHPAAAIEPHRRRDFRQASLSESAP